MQKDIRTIGERISDLLEQNNISQKELSDRVTAAGIKLSTATLSDIISNVDKGYSYKIFVEISKQLNVSTDYLFGLSEVTTSDTKVKAICEYTGLNEEAINRIKTNKYDNTLYSELDAVTFIDYKYYDDYEAQTQYEYDCIDCSSILSEFKKIYSDILNDFIASDCFYSLIGNVMSIFLHRKKFDELLEINSGNFEIFENCNDVKEIKFLLNFLANFDIADYDKLQKLCIYDCQEKITNFCKKYITKIDEEAHYKWFSRSGHLYSKFALNNVLLDDKLNSKEEHLTALKKHFTHYSELFEQDNMTE